MFIILIYNIIDIIDFKLYFIPNTTQLPLFSWEKDVAQCNVKLNQHENKTCTHVLTGSPKYKISAFTHITAANGPRKIQV